MTLKEMFKKVDTYNEVVEFLTGPKVKILFQYGDRWSDAHSFEDYKSLTKYIKREYIEELAELMLKADAWEFGKVTEFCWVDCFGDKHTTYLTVEIVEV